MGARYSWLLLDADGTLFDYDAAEANALELAFGECGHPFLPEYKSAYRQVNRQVWRRFEQGTLSQARLKIERFELLFAALGLEVDPAAFSDRYLMNLSQSPHLIDGAARVAEELARRSKLMLITNGLQQVQRPRIAMSAISAFLDGVVISEEVGHAKPHPGIFDVAFEQMRGPAKSEVLMVGDSLSADIRGGIDYGLDTCWFNPSGAEGDNDCAARYEIDDLAELLRIVDDG